MSSLIEKINSFRLQRGFRILTGNLKKLPEKMSTRDVIEFLFSKKGALITPWQFTSEITSLFKLYESLKPQYALEIGTANGGTLFGHCRLANDNATVISVDLPGGKFGGGYPDWKIPIYKNFAKKNQTLHLVRASSYDPATIEHVKGLLKDNKLDYLFIDGDHTYEGVKKDFDLYSQFVKPGGVIVFHDVVPHPGSHCKVDVFWNEIKQKYEHKEFIDKPDQDHFGVGVLFYK